jgi:AcrR family transcriptional regulator
MPSTDTLVSEPGSGEQPDGGEERPVGAEERVVDAALRCLARWGMAKTTLDDVAREAGIGRATLYRLFPGGREALMQEVVGVETARFLRRLDARVAGVDSVEDLIVGAVVEAATTLATHEAFQFLLAHEPEAIVPHLAFGQMDAVLRQVSAHAGPYLDPWLPDGEAAARVAEWLARIVLSYVCALPAPAAGDICDEAWVRHLVRVYVVPGLSTTDHQPRETNHG